MRRPADLALALLVLVPARLDAQGTEVEGRIAAALAAAPPSLRGTATVLGAGGDPRPGDPLGVLRHGEGPLVCLADDPAEEGFHVACYHRDLDPYMALGRRLRAEGADRAAVRDARAAALESGEIAMPAAAALHSITAAEGAWDPRSGSVREARRLTVVYVPGATGASTGLPTRPEEGRPWLMLPGTPWAHIMIGG